MLDTISLLCLIITFREPISTVQQLRLFVPIMRPEVGYDSSVGITTRYRLDGLEIEHRWGRYFPHPSRPAMGPT